MGPSIGQKVNSGVFKTRTYSSEEDTPAATVPVATKAGITTAVASATTANPAATTDESDSSKVKKLPPLNNATDMVVTEAKIKILNKAIDVLSPLDTASPTNNTPTTNNTTTSEDQVPKEGVAKEFEASYPGNEPPPITHDATSNGSSQNKKAPPSGDKKTQDTINYLNINEQTHNYSNNPFETKVDSDAFKPVNPNVQLSSTNNNLIQGVGNGNPEKEYNANQVLKSAGYTGKESPKAEEPTWRSWIKDHLGI